VAGLSSTQEFALAHRERHIHGVLADDGREDAAVRTDDVALGQSGASDLAGDRGNDVGVAEVDLRRLQVRLIGHDGALRFPLRRDGFVQRLTRAYVLRIELLLPLPVLHRELVLGLAGLQLALGLLDRCLEQAFFDAVERLAFLDQVAFLEQDRLQVTLYSRSDLDAVDGVDPSDEVERLRDRPQLGLHDAHRNGCRPFRMRGRRERADQCRQDDCPHVTSSMRGTDNVQARLTTIGIRSRSHRHRAQDRNSLRRGHARRVRRDQAILAEKSRSGMTVAPCTIAKSA
jgi:hypothetical protein